MTVLSLLLDDFHIMVGKRIRRVKRCPLKAFKATVLTEDNEACTLRSFPDTELFQFNQSEPLNSCLQFSTLRISNSLAC